MRFLNRWTVRLVVAVLLPLGILGSALAEDTGMPNDTHHAHPDSSTTANHIVISSGQQIIDAASLNGAGSLSVSEGATVIIDFGTTSIISLTGNIDNSGSIYAVSTNPSVTDVNLSSQNIYNNPGALITTILPPDGFSGVHNLVQNLGLTLNAVNNIVNAGTISSAANLSMTAGNSITNESVISAVQNITVLTGVADLINSGIINSIAGNIDISSLAAQNLIVNNTNGAMQALLGNINIATMATTLEKLNLSVLGGDILSKELNITALAGIASIDVNELSGILNVSAGEVHVRSNTASLNLGQMSITGDPTFFNPGGDIQITGNLSFAGQNLALIASGNIYTVNGSWSISTASAGNAGSILMVAGVSMTPDSGGTGGNTGGTPASTSLTLAGVSATGGSIDLTGGGNNNITSLDASSTGGSGGTVTLIAYAGPGSGTGTITIPSAVTIQTGTTNNTVFAQNGNVTIIAGASSGNAISVGSINSSGNTISGVINNGIVNIFSGSMYNGTNPVYLEAANQSNIPTSYTYITGGLYAGQTFITVSDATNITASQTLTINPTGANSEVVTVSASYTSGTTIPLANPLALNHGSAEYVMTTVNSITTASNAGTAGNPIVQEGGTFIPGAIQSGNITVGNITAGANVIIATNGTVNLTGSITLTQNPTASANYNNTPVVQITGNQVVVSSGATVSSAISGCTVCQDRLNIYTPSLSNTGTISGSYVNIQNLTTGLMTVSNAGTISGLNANAMVNLQSAGGLQIDSGSAASGTISVPALSVIAISAADNNSINIAGSQFLNGGTNGLVTISAQGANGSLNFSQNTALKISGGPIVSISTPTINFANLSSIQGLGASNFIFTSGALTQSPQPLTISVAAGGSAEIQSNNATSIILRPTDGQNIHFTSAGAGASLAFSGTPVYLFTGTSRATGTAGQVVTDSTISVTATTSYSAVDPNGGITGVAFEPYVGPATDFSANPKQFTLYSTYTYTQVLLLMGQIAQTGLFQSLGTYTQGANLVNTTADPNQMDSYIINGAAMYTIEAAKQMGFQVTAGAYVHNPDLSILLAGTKVEIDYALKQASAYGNVMDIVVGNECIVGGTDPVPSTTSLIQAIDYAQNQRNTTTSFTATSLPVTTRQTYGVLSGVTLYQSTVDLLNGCTNCQSTYGTIGANFEGTNGHVYADVYPYYDQPIIDYLGANPGISQSDFQTLVTNNPNTVGSNTTGIQPDLNGTISAFSSKSIVPQLWVAETGWATASTESNNTQSSTPPNNAPQANPTWAGWYYPDMQSWSYNNKSSNSLGYQIPIVGYFEAFDEPWKYSASTGQGGEPNFGIWTANGTTTTSPNQQYTITGFTQKYTLPIFNLQNSPLPKPQQAQESAHIQAPLPLFADAPPTFNNFAAISNAVFDQSLANVSASLSSSRGTIIPTDVNPEIRNGENESTVNPAVTEPATNKSSTSSTDTTLTGQALFSELGIGLNPAQQAISFSGNHLLLAPDHNLSVNTKLAEIQIAAGAAVMLIQTDNEVAIYALHNNYNGSVKASINGQTIEIPVGHQLLLSRDHNASFDKINPSEISYRNVSDGKIGDLKAYMSEFSLSTAFSTTPSLRQLFKSTDKGDRRLAGKLYKTAAAMTIVRKDTTPFKASR